MIRFAAVTALLLLYSQFPFMPAMVYSSAALQFAAAIVQNAFLARILVTKNESVSLANSHLVVLLMLSAYSSVKLLRFAMSTTHIFALAAGTFAQVTLSLFFDGLVADRDSIMHFLRKVCQTIKDLFVTEYEANVFFQNVIPVVIQVCWRLATVAAHAIIFVLQLLIKRSFTKKEQEKVKIESVSTEFPDSIDSSSFGKESASKRVLGISEEAAPYCPMTGSRAPKKLVCFWEHNYVSEQSNERMRRKHRDRAEHSEQPTADSPPSSLRPLPESVKKAQVDDELTPLLTSKTVQETETGEEVNSEISTPAIPVAIKKHQLERHAISLARDTSPAAPEASSKEDPVSLNASSSSKGVSSSAAPSLSPEKGSLSIAQSSSRSEGPLTAAPSASSAQDTTPARSPSPSHLVAESHKEELQAVEEPTLVSPLASASVASPCEDQPAVARQPTPAAPSLSSTQATAPEPLASASVSAAEDREKKPEATEQPTPIIPLSAASQSPSLVADSDASFVTASSPVANSDASFVTASSTPPSSPVESAQTLGLPVTPSAKAAAPDCQPSPSSGLQHLQNRRSAQHRRYARSGEKSTSKPARHVVLDSPTGVRLVKVPPPSPSAINPIQELESLNKIPVWELPDTKAKKKTHSYRMVKGPKEYIERLNRRLKKRYQTGLHQSVNEKKLAEKEADEKVYATSLESIILSLQKLSTDPGAMIVDRPEKSCIHYFSPPSVDRVLQDADSPMVDVDVEDASRQAVAGRYPDLDAVMEDAELPPDSASVYQCIFPSSPEVVMEDVAGDERKIEVPQRWSMKNQISRYQEPDQSQPFLRASQEVARSSVQDTAADPQPQRSQFASLPASTLPPPSASIAWGMSKGKEEFKAPETTTQLRTSNDYKSASLSEAYSSMIEKNKRQSEQPVVEHSGHSYSSAFYRPQYVGPSSQSSSTVPQIAAPTQPAAMAPPFKRTTPYQHTPASVLQSQAQATGTPPRNADDGHSQAPQSSASASSSRILPPPTQAAGAPPRSVTGGLSQAPLSSGPGSSSRGLQPPPQVAGGPPRNVNGRPSQAPQSSTSTSSSRKVPPPSQPAVGLQQPFQLQGGVPRRTSGVQSFTISYASASSPGRSPLSNVENAAPDAQNDQRRQ